MMLPNSESSPAARELEIGVRMEEGEELHDTSPAAAHTNPGVAAAAMDTRREFIIDSATGRSPVAPSRFPPPPAGSSAAPTSTDLAVPTSSIMPSPSPPISTNPQTGGLGSLSGRPNQMISVPAPGPGRRSQPDPDAESSRQDSEARMNNTSLMRLLEGNRAEGGAIRVSADDNLSLISADSSLRHDLEHAINAAERQNNTPFVFGGSNFLRRIASSDTEADAPDLVPGEHYFPTTVVRGSPKNAAGSSGSAGSTSAAGTNNGNAPGTDNNATGSIRIAIPGIPGASTGPSGSGASYSGSPASGARTSGIVSALLKRVSGTSPTIQNATAGANSPTVIGSARAGETRDVTGAAGNAVSIGENGTTVPGTANADSTVGSAAASTSGNEFRTAVTVDPATGVITDPRAGSGDPIAGASSSPADNSSPVTLQASVTGQSNDGQNIDSVQLDIPDKFEQYVGIPVENPELRRVMFRFTVVMILLFLFNTAEGLERLLVEAQSVQQVVVFVMFAMALIVAGYVGARDFDQQLIFCYYSCHLVIAVVCTVSLAQTISYFCDTDADFPACQNMTEAEMREPPTCSGRSRCKDIAGVALKDREHECKNEMDFHEWQIRRIYLIVPQGLLCGVGAYFGYEFARILQTHYGRTRTEQGAIAGSYYAGDP